LEGMMDLWSFSSSEEEQDETGPSAVETAMAVNFVAQMPPVTLVGNPMELLFDSSSSSKEEERPWGGSVAGKAPNKPRNFQRAKDILYKQYFRGETSTFAETDFEQCFLMPREVFMKVKDAVIGEGLFRESGKAGIDPLVRLTACLRKMAYGTSSDIPDEKFEISESIINRDFITMCQIVKDKLGGYLNSKPTLEVVAQVQAVNAGRGFPGIFASWDCKHFPWIMCPMALQGQHKSGAKPAPSLILEAICDPHLYIWFHHFGEPGSLNNINVLNKSSILFSIFNGELDLLTTPTESTMQSATMVIFLWMAFALTGPSSLTLSTNHRMKRRLSLPKPRRDAEKILREHLRCDC